MTGQEALYNSLFTRAIIDWELETLIISLVPSVMCNGGQKDRSLKRFPSGGLAENNKSFLQGAYSK